MKKLLLILLCLPLLFSTCKKEDDDPIIYNTSIIEQIIVDKIWEGRVPDYQNSNWDDIIFELKSNDSLYTYTVGCPENISTNIGTWDITGNFITYNFVSNSTEYLNLPFGELTEYSDTQLKFKMDTNVNAICEIYNLNTQNCTYIPDYNFEIKLIQLGYDNVLDHYVLTSNIDGVTFLDLTYGNISDLTGIEDFTALTTLDCSDNQLTNLDLDQNTALTTLYCRSNQLTNLDLDQNTALTTLFCSSNQLTSHKIFRNNTALTTLECYDNQLTSLDVSYNTALTYFNCHTNELTSLNVSNNTDLTYFDCSYNQLSSLNVSNNTALTYFNCSYNQLSSLDVRNGNNDILFDFYVSSNPFLNCISVDDAAWSYGYWGDIDAQSYFSEDCP